MNPGAARLSRTNVQHEALSGVDLDLLDPCRPIVGSMRKFELAGLALKIPFPDDEPGRGLAWEDHRDD